MRWFSCHVIRQYGTGSWDVTMSYRSPDRRPIRIHLDSAATPSEVAEVIFKITNKAVPVPDSGAWIEYF